MPYWKADYLGLSNTGKDPYHMNYRAPIAPGLRTWQLGANMINAARRYKAPYRRTVRGSNALVVPGYTRRSGYYGRYGTRASGSMGEQKFHDHNVGTDIGAVANTLEVSQIAVVPQGATESERVGRKMIVHSIALKGLLSLGDGTDFDLSADIIRVYIIQDMQTNGGVFGATQLLETDNFQSFNNLANKGRFKILKVKEYSFRSQSAASTTAPAIHFGEDIKPVHLYLKCKIPIEFDNSAATGVVTSCRSNNIYVCFMAATGSNNVTFIGMFI